MTDAPRGHARTRWLEVLAIVVLSFAAHASALHGTDFTVDDGTIVRDNARLVIDGPRDLWRLVTTSYWAEDYEAERLWRPVVLLSFALDRALFGPEPDAFRAVNVGLHALTSLLALALFARLLPSRRAALAGALLFAIHPVHAEATSGIVGRAEVQALLFALAGMLLHVRAREATLARGDGVAGAWRRSIAPALAFALGFGAKEVALTAPFILALLEATMLAPRWRGALDRRVVAAPYATYLVAIVAYLAARWWVLKGLVPPPEAQSIGVLGLEVRVLVAAEVSLKGLANVLVPPRTAAVFPFDPPAWSQPAAVARAVLSTALVVTGALAALRGRRGVTRAFGVGLMGYYMSLGPTSNLIPIGVVYADRLLYTPSLWALLALTALATPLVRRWRSGAALALLVALSLLALRLGENARAWAHGTSVWRVTVQRFPDLAMAHHGLATALVGDDEIDAAIPHVMFALEHEPLESPRAPDVRALLGRILYAKGRYQEALAPLQDALSLDPRDGNAWANLILVKLTLLDLAPEEERPARLAALEQDTVRALENVPHDYRLWLYRGTILSRFDGREAEAEAAYDRAITRRPAPWEALVNRARLRHGTGRLDEALEDYRRAGRHLREGRPGKEGLQHLPVVMLAQAVLAEKLGRTPDADEARAWLAAHRPDLLERLPSRS